MRCGKIGYTESTRTRSAFRGVVLNRSIVVCGLTHSLVRLDANYLESAVTTEEILAKVAAGEIPVEEASKLLEKAEQSKKGSLYCKVSEKGAISVYGLQQMPVTLYVEQWERLLDFGDELRRFLKEHDAELKRKER